MMKHAFIFLCLAMALSAWCATAEGEQATLTLRALLGKGNSGHTGSLHSGNSGSNHGGNAGSFHSGNSGSNHGGNSGSSHGGNSGSNHGSDSGSNHGGNSGSSHGGNSGSSHESSKHNGGGSNTFVTVLSGGSTGFTKKSSKKVCVYCIPCNYANMNKRVPEERYTRESTSAQCSSSMMRPWISADGSQSMVSFEFKGFKEPSSDWKKDCVCGN